MPLELDDLEAKIRAAFTQRANDVPSMFPATFPADPEPKIGVSPRRRGVLVLTAAAAVLIVVAAIAISRSRDASVEPSQSAPVTSSPAPASSIPSGALGPELPLNQEASTASDSLLASLQRRMPGVEITLVRMEGAAPILVWRGETGSNIEVVDETGTRGTFGAGFTNDRDLHELIGLADAPVVDSDTNRFYVAWTRVPAGTDYVTFQYGDQHAWQRPITGIAYWTLTGSIHPSLGPEPLTMRAFDAAGTELGEATKTPIQDGTGAWSWITR
jgi:hypothetical protein